MRKLKEYKKVVLQEENEEEEEEGKGEEDKEEEEATFLSTHQTMRGCGCGLHTFCSRRDAGYNGRYGPFFAPPHVSQ